MAEYREAEPLTGLEARVLQRLQLHAGRSRKLWWRWSAIAATAVLALAAWIGLRERVVRYSTPSTLVQKQSLATASKPATPPIQAAQKPPQPDPQLAAGKERARAPRPSDRTQSAGISAPMLPQFPASAPLTSSERVLLALAHTHPQLLGANPDDDQELDIAPITIKPLAGDESEHEGEN